ncbi:SGNH/GDSL hydrolase family protein [Spirulina subsalsa FACHB-351]|uniref:SGNH/GDSL hydrolase family protein n=1 Tax=Spirulina subsalsa FACHB-351 TaxID=234711 RepID=A0ABT3L8Z6_9CYAN|nr:SGNH/GDSL hydrolase family protein [Spirulina subsalsa]MCW6037993.1 SGNH/GDSL hydrolase family protein [Spirulina subsalsa FACHB-351]
MDIWLIVVLVGGILLGGLEVTLRVLFGFGDPLVYIPDEEIGYLLAPNQRVKRMGNRVEINQFSMRGQGIEKDCPMGGKRVLLLGDSVANGGWWTDQEQIISRCLEGELGEKLGGIPVQVLNASANSWGPRNELAYVQRFGLFGARVVVVLINTDDLFGVAPSPVLVGRDRNYPDRKPLSALTEVYSRYLTPARPVPQWEAHQKEPGDRVGFNLAALEGIYAIAQAQNAHLIIALTPLLRELDPTGPKDYEIIARNRLQSFTEAHPLTYIDFLPLFAQHSQPEALYRDHIHLSPRGNQEVSQTLIPPLLAALKAP